MRAISATIRRMPILAKCSFNNLDVLKSAPDITIAINGNTGSKNRGCASIKPEKSESIKNGAKNQPSSIILSRFLKEVGITIIRDRTKSAKFGVKIRGLKNPIYLNMCEKN